MNDCILRAANPNPDPVEVSDPVVPQTGLLGPLAVPDRLGNPVELEALSVGRRHTASLPDGVAAFLSMALGRSPLSMAPDTLAMYIVHRAASNAKQTLFCGPDRGHDGLWPNATSWEERADAKIEASSEARRQSNQKSRSRQGASIHVSLQKGRGYRLAAVPE